jgi:hypothetical protein
VKPIKSTFKAARSSDTKLRKIAKVAQRGTGHRLSAKQPVREHQISDISRFWVNDVTLMKLLKIANRKFHDLSRLCRRIHGKMIVSPRNERNDLDERKYPNIPQENFQAITRLENPGPLDTPILI